MAEYVDAEKARGMSGLRLVLTAGVPGPWSEAAKAILHVKRLPYARVRQDGGGENAELVAWTGQASAPVAVWNDEAPRTTSLEILHLAERLQPEPRLLPEDPEERGYVLGTCLEIIGEQGIGWCRRLMMFDAMVGALPAGSDIPETIRRMCDRYLYSREAAAAAPARVAAILRMLAGRLRRGGDGAYLCGGRLTAADLYWATFAALLSPLPPEVCPMPGFLRRAYTVTGGVVLDALDPILLAHRDRIYRDWLELPLDF